MYIELVPVKGGVGTSTIAAALASQLSYMGRDTCIFAFTSHEVRDQQSLWGTGHYQDMPQTLRTKSPNGQVTLLTGEVEADRYWLDLDDIPPTDDLITIRPMGAVESVFDQQWINNWTPNAPLKKIAVTEQTYLGLSNFAARAEEFDAAIVMGKSNAVLTMRDCEAVLQCKHVFPWGYDDGVLRAIDAGLWPDRIARHRFRDHVAIIEYLTEGMNTNV